MTIQGYSSVERIGEGGFGTLYRAVRDSTGDVVAIKELWNVSDGSPIALRLRRELDVLLPLHGNPYVVEVEDIIEGPNGLCLVMEFAVGGSLMDRLKRSPLSQPELVLAGLHASRALAAAHSLCIVHGDVKPQNMLIDLFGQVKLCDFGIAALFRASNGIGPADDVYSFGTTMVQLATGKRPTPGEQLLPDPTDADTPDMAVLFDGVQRCLSFDPDERPTMADLVDLFEAASDEVIDATPIALERIGVLHPPLPRPPVRRPKSPARIEFERASLEAELARRAAIQDELEVSRRHSRNVRTAVTSGAALLGVLALCLLVVLFTRTRGNNTDILDPGAVVAANPDASRAAPYFQVLTKPSEQAFAAAQALVEPQSAAAEYLYHEQRVFEARKLDGAPTQSNSFIDHDSIKLCAVDSCRTSVTFSNFDLVGNNQLVSFDVDGEPLEALIDIWSAADAPCGASYIEALGGTATDTCLAENLVLTVRSVMRDPSGAWTVTYDWKHGSQWAQNVIYADVGSSGLTGSPIQMKLGTAVLQASAWSTTVPRAGTTAVGYATFDVPDGATLGDAQLTISTVSSDESGAWGCDGTPVCALAVDFAATSRG